MKNYGLLLITVLFIVGMICVPILAIKPEVKSNDPGGSTGQGGNGQSLGPPAFPGKSDQSNGKGGTQTGDPGPSDNPGRRVGKDSGVDIPPPSKDTGGGQGSGQNVPGNTGTTKIPENPGTVSEIQGSYASALHLLPPLGESVENETSFDRNLLDFLNVTICEFNNDNCLLVAIFTSNKEKGGMDSLRLQNYHYHVNWKLDRKDPAILYKIQFSVVDLDVGYFNYSVGSNRTVPIKFQIDPVPQIRARVMHEQGASALEIASALKGEFKLCAGDAVEILLNEGYPKEEVGEAIVVTYGMNAQEGAIFLKTTGYSAQETYNVLMQVFEIQDEIEIEEILYTAGYSSAEFVHFTARGSVGKFSPVLKFDGSYKGLPMSAQTYFQSMLTLTSNPVTGEITWTVPWNGPSPCNIEGRITVCSRDECNCGMQNNNFSTLTNGEVPTYYQVISDIETTGEGRLRIAYWWFYGFQEHCNSWDVSSDGSHHGDWEKVIVTTNQERTRVDAVTYEFHGDWYTRRYGGFESVGDHPVAYVGKLGHGNYHSNEISGWMVGTPSHCCEYADYRNPKSYTIWYNTNDNLVSLKGNAEPWMLADQIGSTYRYQGQDFTIINWRWGPHISYCDWWLFGCMDWVHTNACQTHPTIYNLNWNMGSCSAEGCGTCCCKGLVYTHDAHYNQGWP